MRHIHRTVLARCCATLLLLLAASPLTAPFTTCDVTDFVGDHQPAPVPHPGHEVAVPNAKISPTVDDATCAGTPAFELIVFQRRDWMAPLITKPQRRPTLQAVLRI